MIRRSSRSDEIVRTKYVNKGGTGSFLSGFIVGIIFLVLVVIGGGYYGYKYLSIADIESKTNVDIPIKDEVKNSSIEQFIALSSGVFSDPDTLTLEKIEDTFGIANALGYGIPVALKNIDGKVTVLYDSTLIDEDCINLYSLKTTALKNLSTEISNSISKITLNQIEKISNVTLPDIPLINDLLDKPVMEAVNSLAENMDFSTMTLTTLSNEFGLDLASIPGLSDFANYPLIDSGDDVTSLSEAIETATVGNFTELSQQAEESNEAYAYRLQEAGIMGVLADKKITDLSNAFDTLTFGELFGLTSQYERTGIEGAYIYTLESSEALDYRVQQAGIIGLLKDSTMKSDFDSIITSKTIGNLLGYDKNIVRSGVEGSYIYTYETDEEYNLRLANSGVMASLKDSTFDSISTDILELKVNQIMPDATGVMSVLGDTKIKDVSTEILNLNLVDIISAENITDGSILDLVRLSTLSTVGDDIQALTIGQMTGATDGLLGALAGSTISTLQADITALDLDNKTILELEDLDLIDLADMSAEDKALIENKTMIEIIQEYITAQALLG